MVWHKYRTSSTEPFFPLTTVSQRSTRFVLISIELLSGVGELSIRWEDWKESCPRLSRVEKKKPVPACFLSRPHLRLGFVYSKWLSLGSRQPRESPLKPLEASSLHQRRHLEAVGTGS